MIPIKPEDFDQTGANVDLNKDPLSGDFSRIVQQNGRMFPKLGNMFSVVGMFKAIIAKWYYAVVGFSLLTLYNAYMAVGPERVNAIMGRSIAHLGVIAETAKCFRYIDNMRALYRCVHNTN